MERSPLSGMEVGLASSVGKPPASPSGALSKFVGQPGDCGLRSKGWSRGGLYVFL